jgi:putative ABC transport system permease protein
MRGEKLFFFFLRNSRLIRSDLIRNSCMNVQENTRLALLAIAANKLRAALTMLGILIGVAAVITLLAIGDGVTRFVADQFIGLGTNLVFVLPTDDPTGEPR